MTDLPPNPLAAILASYAPGRVLQLAGSRDVHAGLKLFSDLVVRFDGWNGPDMVCFNIHNIVVEIRREGEEVVPLCHYCEVSGCRHTVAVMASIVQAMRGKTLLSVGRLDDLDFDEIRKGLGTGPRKGGAAKPKPSKPKPSPDGQKVRLHLARNNYGVLDVLCKAPRISLSMRGSGSYVGSFKLRQLPAEVRDFFDQAVVDTEELEQRFFEWIVERRDKYPVYVDGLRDMDPRTRVDRFLTERLMLVTNLRRDADRDRVVVESILARMEEDVGEEGKAVPVATRFYPLGERLVFVPEQNALGLLCTPVGGKEDEWEESRGYQAGTASVAPALPREVSINGFNMEGVVYDPSFSDIGILTLLDGRTDTSLLPEPLEVEPTIEVSPDFNNRIHIAFRADPNHVLSSYIEELDEGLQMSLYDVGGMGRRTSQKSAFYRAVGRALLDRREEAWREVTGDFNDEMDEMGYAVPRHAEMVFSWANDTNKVTDRLLAAPSGTGLPPWLSAGMAEVAALFGVVWSSYCDLGPSREWLPTSSGEILCTYQIATAKWTEGLRPLAGLCEKHNIKLKIAGKPVALVSLDCRVRARTAEGADPVPAPDGDGPIDPDLEGEDLDWFELHPEVFFGNQTVSANKWTEIITGNGFRTDEEGGGAHLVPDAASVRKIQMLVRAGLDATDDDDSVRVPRLKILDWIHLRSEGIEVDIPEEDAAMVDGLLSGEPREPVALPGTIKATLRPYQMAGFQWLAFLYAHRFGAVLADDMGLGKTLQAIALFAALHDGSVPRTLKKHRPHLVVVPPTLLFNWQSEIERFAPHFRMYEYTGSARSIDKLRQTDIALTSYEIARRDIDDLRLVPFDVVLFDEAQAVKNMASKRSKAIRQLQARFKVCLTGTPLENSVMEYYSIVELALPGLLGERKAFSRAMRNGDTTILRRVRPFVMRRTKGAVLSDLPAKVESDVYLELDSTQREYYTRCVAEIREEVAKAFADKPKQQAGIIALAALTRLRQICVAPQIIDSSRSNVAPKINYLVEKLEELEAEGHAALVFSQFTRVLDLTGAALDKAGLEFQRLDGSTTKKERKRLVETYQSGDGPGIFMISLKAGGAGLNLTRATYVFHLDPWWNPAVENQASDRAHRIGQKHKVFIHRILMRNTIEDKMMILKGKKQKVYDQIMGSAEEESVSLQSTKSPMITQKDLKMLLG